jgi:hypothetical protein
LKLAEANKKPFDKLVYSSWFDDFFNRNPKIRSVVSSRVERLHASGANADIISKFFVLLENLLAVRFN